MVALPAAVTSDSAESDTANGTNTTAADGTPDPEISQALRKVSENHGKRFCDLFSVLA